MKKLLALCTGILLVAAIFSAAVWLDPTYILWGSLRGEQFYNRRPTSYWSNEVKQDSLKVWEAFGLGFDARPDPNCIPVLLELLHDKDDQVCYGAASMITNFGSDASEATPIFINWLNDSDVYRRRNGAHALASIIRRGERDAVPGLIRGIKVNDPFINYPSAIALGRIGPAAQAALPALIELSKSDRTGLDQLGKEAEQHTIGEAAAWAIEQIGRNDDETE